MSRKVDPKLLSQMELDYYLDELVDLGLEDTTMFERAYAEWERRESE